MDPKRAVELILNSPWNGNDVIRVFWIRVQEGSRAEFAAQVSTYATDEGPVPLIIRDALFLSANSVLSDVSRLFSENQGLIQQVFRGKSPTRINIAILAREAFRLPQVSSPLTLPHWFPALGGREIHFRLSDLEEEAEVDLVNSEECSLDQMASFLAHFEEAATDRLRRLQAAGTDLSQLVILLNQASQSARENFSTAADALQTFRSHLDKQSDFRAYRPSLRTADSFVSRLLRLVLKSTPDELVAMSKSLGKILDLPHGATIKPALFAVLLRPVQRVEGSARLAHNMVLTVYGSYQFLTAGAHASDYPTYPVALVKSVSVDLRATLAASVQILRS